MNAKEENNMINRLKKMKPKFGTDMLTVDDDAIFSFTGSKDLTITAKWHGYYEGNYIVFVELDTYYLIAHNLDGEPKYAVCELYDVGPEYLDSETEFLEKIKLRGGDSSVVYEQTTTTLSDDDNSPSLSEYITDDDFDYMLVTKQEDVINVYRGITISESNIIL
jgi:hypothetical protein